MPKATAIDEVILAVVSALDAALAYRVLDGSPIVNPEVGTGWPSDHQFIVVGGNLTDPEAPFADMDSEYTGLGTRIRTEELRIYCAAVGRAHDVKDARALAVAAVNDVGQYLAAKPTAATYNAIVSNVNNARIASRHKGTSIQIEFTITCKARLAV